MHCTPSLLAAAVAVSVLTPFAHSHIGYTGRNFGVLSPEVGPITIAGQTVSSAFGWADATDDDWGDSHRGRFYRFTLTSISSVTITASRNDLPHQTGAADYFLPAFSLYLGLGHLAPFRASHDSSALSVASRPPGTEGSLRALHDWSIGNDPTYVIAGDPTSGILYPADLRFFTYIGHAADGTAANYGPAPGILGDGVADGVVTATFHGLVPGDYSIFVGGARYDAQWEQTAPPFPTYGVNLTVQAIPEPATVAWWCGGLALVAAVWRRRRSSR